MAGLVNIILCCRRQHKIYANDTRVRSTSDYLEQVHVKQKQVIRALELIEHTRQLHRVFVKRVQGSSGIKDLEDGNAGMLLNYCFYLLYSLSGEGLYNMLFILVVVYIGCNVLTSTI